MRLRDRLPNYLTMSDISDMRQPPDYIIGIDGSYKYGIKTSNGQVISRDTDFYTVFMACHDDAPTATGGNCFIKTGAYSLSAKLLINRPFNIVGAGCNWTKGTVITLADNVNAHMIEYDGGGTNIYFPLIANLMLNGNKTNNASGYGIKFTADASDGIIRNVGITQVKEYSMYVQTARLNLSNCWLEYPGKSCIYGGGGSLRLSNCHLSYGGEYGIYGSAQIHVVNCYIGNCVKSGIHYGGSDNIIKVSNCTITTNSTAGNNLYSGIDFDVGTLLLSNCDIGGTDHKYAVDLLGNSHDSRLSNNYIGAFVTADYSDLGTRNCIEDLGTESSNGEAPADASWPKGTLVQFVDTGDASGNGIYLKDRTPAWRKLT